MLPLLLAATSMIFVPPMTGQTGRAVCPASGGVPLRVDVTGLKDTAGNLRLELYPATPADFLRDDTALISEGKVFRRIVTTPSRDGRASLCIDAPGPGTYALVVIHDRHGRLGFDIWRDGVGLPGSTRLGRHRPAVTEAQVIAGPAGSHVKVRMQYLSGPGGFAPLKS